MSESVVEPGTTPGQLLRAARERTSLSLETIADQLKMTVTKIRALEQDNYQPFPADTYLKGYLRNYARMVNLSEAEVIESYESFVAAHNQQSVNLSLAKVAAESKVNTEKKILALLLLILLSILLSYYYFDNLTGSTDQAGADAVEPSDTAAATNVNTVNSEPGDSGVLEGAGEAITKPALSSVPLAAEQELISGESTESITNGTLAALAIEPVPLKSIEPSSAGYIFSFTGSCWLEVADSRGKKIISQEYRAGERVELEGQGPFKVLLGNASVARLTHNNKPVTITPRKNKNTLRITLKQ